VTENDFNHRNKLIFFFTIYFCCFFLNNNGFRNNNHYVVYIGDYGMCLTNVVASTDTRRTLQSLKAE
jgi:hypothetical protein